MKPFQNVGNPVPGKSIFDLSYSKLFTADMGLLYPVQADEMVPGDVFEFGNEAVIRMNPLVSPVLHQIDVFTHTFFVPYRLLWEDWEDFITGGDLGTDASVLPRWTPTAHGAESLWDYFGFPDVVPLGALPLDFPKRAYNMIWNEYFRDTWIQTEVDIETSEVVLKRSWEKDYFTSATLDQQRGVAPALPISGVSSAVWDDAIFTLPATNAKAVYVSGDHVHDEGFYVPDATGIANLKLTMNTNTVDLSSASTFDVADLRLAFQVQRWLERNARSGARYTESLKAHFGISNGDERVQRPEYCGGSKFPVVVSETLQTSETGTTPQGNMAGHGIAVGQQFCGKYRAKEYGVLITLMSIMPKPMYQQGINRQWLRRSKYDFYWPEFANLSEQAIERAEIYANGVANDNTTIFGYQGRYDEMRYKPNMVCGLMKTDFAHWHLGRIFSTAPVLNTAFLECVPDKRIFAVDDEPGFIVSFGNIIKAIRPLPITGEPGLIDHH